MNEITWEQYKINEVTKQIKTGQIQRWDKAHETVNKNKTKDTSLH